jgi:hypothetical protein
VLTIIDIVIPAANAGSPTSNTLGAFVENTEAVHLRLSTTNFLRVFELICV